MDLDLSNADEAQVQGRPAVSLALLALINQARNEHGMRQQDFRRYRQFCTTKVHRLREVLQKTHTNKRTDNRNKAVGKGTKKGLSKKAKRKAQSAVVQSENNKGTGNVFVRKSISVYEVQDDRPAQLLLFEAERAWAYSQELKQLSFDNDRDGKLRRHGLARARRAAQWSQQLLDLLAALGDERVDVLSRAEAWAYHALLQGYESFDKDKYEQSLEFLSVARKVFYRIAEASNDSRKEALANSFVDGTEAMLRFCAYNLELSEQDMDKLADSTATAGVSERIIKGYTQLEGELKEQAKGAVGQSKDGRLDEVEWREKRIVVRNPDLVDVMAKVRIAEEGLRSSLGSKESSEKKAESGRDHKRQRLTSAQRSAKKRGQSTVTGSTPAAGPSKTGASAGSKTEMDGFDSLLAALTEAEDVARRLVQDNVEALSKSHSGRYEAASSNLVNAHEYLLYKLLATRTERNFSLMDDVQAKSDKRQARVREHVDVRLQALLTPGKSVPRQGKEPVRRRVKPSPKKVRPARQARKSGKKTAGTPYASVQQGKSFGSKKRSPRTKAAEERLRVRGQLKERRIAARIIPGLAKLLDANDMSCAGISRLGLIESDSNLSTLIEAKAAWHKAELLRLLARSFAWSDEHDKGLVLLNRAELFVREARNAMELVKLDEVLKEDKELPPQMSSSTFDKTTEQIAGFRLQVQKELYARQLGASATAALKSISGAQSKAAQAVRDMAAKYVDFDPVDLQQAATIPSEMEERFAAELAAGTGSAPASRRPSCVPGKAVESPRQAAGPAVGGGPASKATSAAKPANEAPAEQADEEDEYFEETEEQGGEAGPYDPANVIAEEEEQAAAEAAASKRGWLGGWFSRNA